jgi:hypothetical protein
MLNHAQSERDRGGREGQVRNTLRIHFVGGILFDRNEDWRFRSRNPMGQLRIRTNTDTRVHTVLIYATHRMAFLPKRVALSDMARWAHVAFEYSMNAKRVSCVGSPASTRCLISPQLEK